MLDHLRKMLRSAAWADGVALAALRECPAAHAEALPLIAHVLAAEAIWLARLRGTVSPLPVRPELSLAECDALAAENAAGYAAYAENVTDADLAAVVHYRTTAGVAMASRAIDILTHVVTHGAYHRGQVAKAVGRAGGQAPNTDYIIFALTVESGPARKE